MCGLQKQAKPLSVVRGIMIKLSDRWNEVVFFFTLQLWSVWDYMYTSTVTQTFYAAEYCVETLTEILLPSRILCYALNSFFCVCVYEKTISVS